MEVLQNITSAFHQIWHLELYRSGTQSVQMSQIIIALLVVIIGILVSKRLSLAIGKRIMKTSRFHKNTVHLLQRVFFYFQVCIIVLIALPIAGIPITIFTVIGGALAIGVGFGVQNLFNNLISGFIIMMERPIRIGDIIEISDNEGRVEEIGNRCVRVRRTDGIDLIVPNSKFLEDNVVNWTLFDSDVRGIVSVGVQYGSPTEKVKALIMEASDSHPKVLQSPKAEVFFQEFGDSSLNFELWFWSNVSSPADLRRVKSELRFKIDALFRENDIVIPFPQRDLHLDSAKPLEVKLSQ